MLVPGFWLGAWAWDDVVAALRADGHDVTAITLPGLESPDADRSEITLSDHVEAICQTVIARGTPVVLAVHSGAGVPGYAASDRIPDRLAAMVYVDSGPAAHALDAAFDAPELPLPSWPELEAGGSSLEGLSGEQLAAFRQRAVPEPGAALRETPRLADQRRLDVPSTVICASMSSDQIKAAVEAGHPWVGELAELRDVSYVDLPTGHWPMWSRAQELAVILGYVARRSTRTLLGRVHALREVTDLLQSGGLAVVNPLLNLVHLGGRPRAVARHLAAAQGADDGVGMFDDIRVIEQVKVTHHRVTVLLAEQWPDVAGEAEFAACIS